MDLATDETGNGRLVCDSGGAATFQEDGKSRADFATHQSSARILGGASAELGVDPVCAKSGVRRGGAVFVLFAEGSAWNTDSTTPAITSSSKVSQRILLVQFAPSFFKQNSDSTLGNSISKEVMNSN